MRDTDGATSTTTLTISITGTNDKPVAVADAKGADVVTEAGFHPGNTAFPGDASATGNVLTNDTDVDTGDSKTGVGVAAGTSAVDVSGSVATSVTGTYDSVQIASNGTWTYTLDNTDPDTNALAQGATAADVFTYTMRDTDGATSTTTLTISITGTNDKPIAVADVNGADVVTEAGFHPGNTAFPGDAGATGNVLTNDTDVDTGDSKTVVGVAAGTSAVDVSGSVATSVTGTYGSVQIASNGTWTYTLDNTDPDTNALAQGATAADVFTYTMRDTDGATSTTTLTISITGTNDKPIAVADVNGADVVTEAGFHPGNTAFPGDAGATGNVLTNDTDVDTGDSKTVVGVAAGTSAVDVSGSVATSVTGTYGSVQIASNGTWTYTLDNTDPDTNALAQGATAADVFTYTMRDTDGATSTTTLTISITGTNDKPIAVADVNGADVVTEAGFHPGNTAFPGDAGATGNVLTNDTDVDTGDSKTVVGVAAGTSAVDVSGSVATSVTGTYGSVQIASNGTWTYTLDNTDPDTNALAQGATAADVFTYTMRDTDGATSTTTLTISITGTNDKPIAVADVNGADVVTEAGFHPGNTAFPGDAGATGNVLTNDTDVDTGDSKTVVGVAAGTSAVDVSGSVATSVTGTYGSVQIASNGTWTYTLDNTDPDTNALAQGATAADVFTYTMRDTDGATSTTTLTISITGTNDKPIAVADVNGADVVTEAGFHPGNTAFPGDAGATGNVLTNDTDVDTGDSKTVVGVAAGTSAVDVSGSVATSVTGTYGSVQIASNGTWTYTLDNTDPDTNALAQGATAADVFTYTMRDTDGATSTTTLTISITGTNDKPIAVADVNGADVVTEAGFHPGNTAFPGDAGATGNVLTNDTDVDTGDSKTVVGVAAGTSAVDVSGSVATSVTGTYGSVQIASNGTWTYTLDNTDPDTNALAQGATAADVFTYTMRDTDGATSTTTLTISITGTNDKPIAVADVNGADVVTEAGFHPGNTAFPGDAGATGNVLTNDTDVDTGDSKTVVGVAAGTSAVDVSGSVTTIPYATLFRAQIASNGTWTYTLDNTDPDTNALAQGATAADVFTYTMQDTDGATS